MSVITQAPRLSPCIGVCQLDDRTGFCLGCGRTGDEIGAWGGLDPTSQDAIWAELPQRLEALSVRLRLLPLMGGEFADWVARTIREGQGTWVTGVPGATAEFPAFDQPAEVLHDGETVTASVPGARFRLRMHEKLRAFAFDGDGPVVLGLPKRRAVLPLAESFTRVGSDEDAIAGENRSEELFDFGLGRSGHRFCIRTGDPDFVSILDGAVGKDWADVLASLGAEITRASPTRVVESALARIEVLSDIPSPDERSPAGPHTHFLPEFLASGDDAPEALKIPEYASPIAIFYPGEPAA
ncbi:hypothetical protein A7A08_00092 [Methyloligella halotolerans]|uniref:DUF1289 domain-containing protein n=1 Tax=Methyloligella halotolerans TaxID=1177755 RepID=A0A1E2S1S1_9HYPH|nr:hypothetical protein A7A08_00092 [Methyloligella halotolerans]